METKLSDLQLRLRAEALDRIRRGYDLVYSGVGILAALSIPDVAGEVVAPLQGSAQNSARNSASVG